MAEVTRKLVIVDLDYVTDPRKAREFPSAEELGRVALQAAWPIHREISMDEMNRATMAVADALTKRTEVKAKTGSVGNAAALKDEDVGR